MELIDCRESSPEQRESAAEVLLEALRHAPSAWKDIDAASAEVSSFVNDRDRLALFAIDGHHVLGWVGGIRHSEYAWELHPLVVRPEHQRRGLGTILVEALEARAQGEGVVTIWLGTDDDFGGTNLFGRNLYPNVLASLGELRETAGHPFRFYERVGYTVTGVFPDADGLGKHDILMAKRVVIDGARV